MNLSDDNYKNRYSLFILFLRLNIFQQQIIQVLKSRHTPFFKTEAMNHSQNQKQSDEKNVSDNIYNNKDYQQGRNMISRYFLVHLVSIATTVKKALNHGLKLNLKHVPTLMEDQKVEYNSKQFIENLNKVTETQELTPMRVWLSLMKVYKKKIVIVFCYQFFNISLKLFNSVALNFCIQATLDNNYEDAYIWGTIMIISMLFSSLFRSTEWMLGYGLNTELRGTFVNTIYKKINDLSGYAIKQSNLGKVINLVSSDLNIVEQKFIFLFQLCAAPFTLTVSCIILGFRLGPLDQNIMSGKIIMRKINYFIFHQQLR